MDVQYEHLDDLVDAAGELILGMPDRPELPVKADSFEWLEGYTGGPQDAHIDWFATVDLAALTERTRDLKGHDGATSPGPCSLSNNPYLREHTSGLGVSLS